MHPFNQRYTMDSSQDYCKGDTKYGRTALYKGKSDSIIMRVSSLDKEFLSESLMQRVGNRKSVSTTPYRKSSYPMQESDDSSTPISFSNVLSRTSSTASLSLGVAGPLIFPSDHALASIVNGSSTSRGEVSSDEADIAYPVGAKYRINPQNVASGNDVQIDIENDCKSVPLPPPPPISLKFVDVKYKVDVCKEDGLLQVWRNVSRAVVAGRFKLTQKKKKKKKKTGKAVVSDAAGEEEGDEEEEKGRWIVKGITGSVEAGEVLALMGPSGSGKTTLLSLLSGRLQPHQNHPHVITYNDLPYSKSLKPRMGFVMQDDVLYPHLTVKETLTYVALLRLRKNLSKNERMERVMEVIYELGLERCQNTIIGGPFLRGVSGGERKRVCMGQEILVDPSLLFLDEPTSGLDSATAFRIVYMLQKISKVGRTVVTTIHQPSSRIFHMFDKVILLSEGHLLYYGKASTVMNYFSSIGFSPQIAMNPADFLLDLASGDVVNTSFPSKFLDQQSDYTSTKSQGHESAMVNLPSSTRPSPKNVREYLYKSYETTLREKSGTLDELDVEKLVKHEHQMENFYSSTWCEREWGASWWSQFCVLYVRGLRERRHEYLSFLRIMQVLASAFIIGCLWWHSSFHTEGQLADQVGLLFFIATYWGFFPLFTALFTFPLERAILAKERASDMYRLSAYFMARTLGDIPLDFCLPLLFHIIVYFMAHLQPRTSTFFLTLLTTLLDTIASQGMGIAIGAVMMDLKKATTLASVTLLTFMLSGGYFVQGIPKFISWIRYLSYNYHTFKLLIKVQYNVNQEFDCNTTMGCQKVADSPILQNMSLDGGATQEVLVLLLMIFGYRLTAYVALRHMRLAI